MNADSNTRKNPEHGDDATPQPTGPQPGPDAPSPDTAADETVSAPEQPGGPASLDGDRAAQLEGEVAALKDQLLRAVAETENVRRRGERERDETSRYAVARFAKELVGVADNLQRALAAVPAESRAADEVLDNLMIGVEATERQLVSAFDKFGVKKLESLGKPFDPNFHQVVMEVEGTGKAAGVVVQVLQEGYVIHDRLLREAMVAVAKQGDNQGHVDTTA